MFRIFKMKVFVFMLFLTVYGNYQQQSEADAWEARHNHYQPPELVMDSLGIEAGMKIAEIGAGKGRFAVHMARRVGPDGIVYANDIDKDALEYLKYRCKRDSIENIKTVLGDVTNPGLPAGTFNLIYLINTYHHLDQPVVLLKNLIPALKENARLVIIEHDPDKTGGSAHSTPKEKILKDAEAAGFKLSKIMNFLERDNIFLFRSYSSD